MALRPDLTTTGNPWNVAGLLVSAKTSRLKEPGLIPTNPLEVCVKITAGESFCHDSLAANESPKVDTKINSRNFVYMK
jgi:hypothetical protein